MENLKTFRKDSLIIQIYQTVDDMGRAAAEDVSTAIKELFAHKEEINIVFAAAPSQNTFFKYFSMVEGIDFSRINAFHMDEYIGLSYDAPQGFGNYLKDHIFGKCNFKSVNYLNGQAENPTAECDRYTTLLASHSLDIVCMGIGENGHIAFNDPGTAKFDDPEVVKIVTLDEKCRQQQVNDGCFKDIKFVPRTTLSLTVPALMNADMHFCMVPTNRKVKAVRDTICNEISETCPASILRRARHATLFIDNNPLLDSVFGIY